MSNDKALEKLKESVFKIQQDLPHDKLVELMIGLTKEIRQTKTEYHNLKSLKKNWKKFDQLKAGLQKFDEDNMYFYWQLKTGYMRHQNIKKVKEIYINYVNFRECTRNEVHEGTDFISYSPLLFVFEKRLIFIPTLSFFSTDEKWFNRMGEFYFGDTFEELLDTIPKDKRHYFLKD